MASKGSRGTLEPQAIMMYGDGKDIKEISKILDVSETTLYRWKSESKIPGEELDGWDKLRKQKQSYVQRARDLLDRQYEYMESLPIEDLDSKVWDSLSKAFAIVERSEKREKEIREAAIREAAGAMEGAAKQAGVSEETIKRIHRDILKIAS